MVWWRLMSMRWFFEGQTLEDALDGGDVGHRFGGGVLAQAEQHQIVRYHGVEGIFGVQIQFGVEAVGVRRSGLRLQREEVVDDAAIGLLQVADRLAQQRRRLQQQAFAALVGLVQLFAAGRGGRDIADRQVFQCQVAALVAEQPEIEDLADLLMLQRALGHGAGQKRLVMIVVHDILP